MATTTAENEINIFSSTMTPREVTSFTLMRGVTDFSNLQQYDLFETGYSFLVCLQIPKFLEEARKLCTPYANLIDSYKHIIEYDFTGAQGIEAMTTETGALTNNIDTLNIITRVTEQGGTNFSMNYFERSGAIITKTHELFLRGIKDPRTQLKRYLGIINGPRTSSTEKSTKSTITVNGKQVSISPMEASYHNEVFHYLLIVTDNTGYNVEKSFILASAQPSQANTDIYNVTKGEIGFSQFAVQMNAFPITGRLVNQKASKLLEYINAATCFDEMEFGYNILSPTTGDEQNSTDLVKTIGENMTRSKIFSGDKIIDKPDTVSSSQSKV